MFEAEQLNRKRKWKWLLKIVAIFLVLSGASIGLIYGYNYFYSNKFFIGTSVLDVNVGGLTWQEARIELQGRIDDWSQDGLNFTYEQKQISVLPILTAPDDPDVVQQIVIFDVYKTLHSAYAFGRSGKWSQRLEEQFKMLFQKQNAELKFILKQDELNSILRDNFFEFEQPPVEARLVIQDDQVVVEFGESGERFDYEELIGLADRRIANLSSDDITLFLSDKGPEVADKQAEALIPVAEALLKKVNYLQFKYQQKSWSIYERNIDNWLSLKITDGKADLSFDSLGLRDFLVGVGSEINVPVRDAKLEIIDGRVQEFQSSRDGLELNINKTIEYFDQQVINEQANIIDLIIDDVKAKVQIGEINDMGISEVVGVGISNFSGSPSNRRQNIRVGMESLNGALIKPGEEFSVVGVLGEIDGDAGYLPELVIKGNKTIPEYGGGLCQIATTMFRVALNSGLEITQRRPHSYRVSYYEPAGTDATIYDPWPDLKFINNTGNHILIQGNISGTELSFTFWGTNDGREVEQSDPVIYNIVKPGEKKIIETLDLSPGEEKCTERAHNGADAYFDYKITYSDGEVMEKRFSSHYVPWQEVCLLGVEEITKIEDEILENSEVKVDEIH